MFEASSLQKLFQKFPAVMRADLRDPCDSYETENDDRLSQNGYIMFVILLFVAFFGSAITSIIIDRDKQENAQLAVASGEYLAKVARAARLYVRDRSIAVPGTAVVPGQDDYHPLRLSTTPIADVGDGTPSLGPTNDEVGATATPLDDVITVNDLIGAGLLPDGFSAVTPLGQQVRIIAANAPIDGDPTDPAQFVVGAAYIYVEANTPFQTLSLNDVIIGLRKSGVAVSGIRHNAAGVNQMPATCRGAQPVGLWDTGCITQAEYETLRGLAPGTPFPPGSLIIPTWRAAQFDLRALMRFPQPENPGYATMLTALRMAEEDCANNIIVNSADTAAPVDTNICQYVNDDNLGDVDLRFDIRNVGALEASGAVVVPQTRVDGFSGRTVDADVITFFDPATSTYQTRRVEVDAGGNVIGSHVDVSSNTNLREGFFVSGNAHLESDLRVFDQNTAAVGLDIEMSAANDRRVTLNTVIARKNVVVTNDAGIAGDTEIEITTLDTDALLSDEFTHESPSVPFAPTEMRQAAIEMNGQLSITGNATINEAFVGANNTRVGTAGADDAIQFSGQTNGVSGVRLNNSGATIAGAAPYRSVIANIGGTGAVDVQGDVSIGNSATFNANSRVSGGGSLNVTNGGGTAICFGDCPDRCATPGPPIGGTICPP